MSEEKLETIISLKDEMTGVAKKVAAAYENLSKKSDKMKSSFEGAEKKLSSMKNSLKGVSGTHKVELKPVNMDAVSTKVKQLEDQLSSLTGKPVSIKATAKVDSKQVKQAKAEAENLKAELEAMTGRKYNVDLDLDSSGFKSQISSLTSSIKTALPAAIIAGLTAGVGTALTKGSERQQYQTTMTHFMGGDSSAAKDMMSWANQNARATQFSSSEVLAATSRAIQIADGSASEAKRLTQLAEDMASLTPGKSVMDAMEALADASMGEFERMKEFGFKGSAEAYEAAGNDFWSMKSTSNGKTVEEMFAGGTAAGAQNASAKVGTILGTFEDAIANTGEKILNGLNPALDWMIQKSEQWGPSLEGVFTSIGNTVNSAVTALQPFAPVLNVVSSVISGVVTLAFNTIGSVANNVVIPVLNVLGDVFGVGVDVAEKLFPKMEGVGTVAEEVTKLFKGLSTVVENVTGAIGDFAGGISDAIGNIGSWISSKIGKNATGAISFGGGFTQMNENGRGEIVSLPNGSKIYPYSTTKKIIEKMAGGSLRSNTSNVFNINIDARNSNLSKQDIRKIKREIVNEIVEAIDNVPA